MKTRVKRATFVATGVFITLVVLYWAGAWVYAGLIITPGRHSLEHIRDKLKIESVADYGLPAPKNIRIDTGDVILDGWFFDNEKEAGCGVLMLHGFTANRYAVVPYAPLFWPRGCDLLMYDARRHGRSTGDYATFGYYEKEDARRALAWFTQQTGLEKRQVGLMGVSYGAATVLQTGPLEPEVAFILADSPYQDLATIAGEKAEAIFGAPVRLIFLSPALHIASVRAGFDPAQVSPMQAARAIQAPVLIVHSLQDTFIIPAHAEAIYANIPSQQAVLHLTDWGAPHPQSIFYDPETYKSYVDIFLAEYVPDFGTTQTDN